MLQLRPSCEHCNSSLPANALNAMICSYECTFCVSCVENVLHNICPNCGGGFVPRPIRPSKNLKNGNYLGKHPASKTITFKPVDAQSQAQLVSLVAQTPPHLR